MATRFLARSLLTTTKQTISSALSRSYASLTITTPPSSLSTFSLLRLRPLIAANIRNLSPAETTIRGFATRQTSSSLNDPNPNWSNRRRPTKETILLDGCDFEHWLIVMEKPEGEPTRYEIIDSYIKTLAMVVGSEEEARMKIYSISTKHYFAFGALISEELSYKMEELPRVRLVLPDSYSDVMNKDYGREPFINGQAVPYDPKYHEEWVEKVNPRNFRRKNRGYQSPMPNMGGPSNMIGVPSNNMGRMPPNTMGGMQPNNMGGAPPNSMGALPNRGGLPPNMGGAHLGGMPPTNMGGMSPNNMGAVPPNNAPNFQYRNGPNNGGMPYQSGPGPNREYQNSYAANAGGNPFQTQNMPGGDMPPPLPLPSQDY